MFEVETAGSVKVLTPQRFLDDRGFFCELYNDEVESIVGTSFVQDNLAFSYRGVARGLHFQKEHVQSKLVSCLAGKVLDVYVDLREGPQYSTFGYKILKGSSPQWLFIPAGFAHGYIALEDSTLLYRVDDVYHPQSDSGINISLYEDNIYILTGKKIPDFTMSGKDKALPAALGYFFNA